MTEVLRETALERKRARRLELECVGDWVRRQDRCLVRLGMEEIKEDGKDSWGAYGLIRVDPFGR